MNWAIDVLPYMQQQGLHKSFVVDAANDIYLYSETTPLEVDSTASDFLEIKVPRP